AIGKARAVARIDRIQQRDAKIVEEAQAAERLWQLKAAGEPQPGALVSRHAVDRAAVEDDGAAIVVQGAGETVDERALAGAVRTDQAQPLAGANGDVDILQRDKAAKAFAEPADLED